MSRISKVLNHNTIIAIEGEKYEEYLIMGKGIGFGKRFHSFLNFRQMYRFTHFGKQKRRDAREMAKTISPLFMEIASMQAARLVRECISILEKETGMRLK